MNFHKDQNACPESETIGAVCPPAFTKLPGIETINYVGSQWDGVTKDDLVASAWGGYKLNNNANGYQMPSISRVSEDGAERAFPFPDNIRTPGYIQAPICKITPDLINKLKDLSIEQKSKDLC
jgi:hypothetical protein